MRSVYLGKRTRLRARIVARNVIFGNLFVRIGLTVASSRQNVTARRARLANNPLHRMEPTVTLTAKFTYARRIRRGTLLRRRDSAQDELFSRDKVIIQDHSAADVQRLAGQVSLTSNAFRIRAHQRMREGMPSKGSKFPDREQLIPTISKMLEMVANDTFATSLASGKYPPGRTGTILARV